MLFYQASFSHFLGGNCRHYPTCSYYALEVFKNQPFQKAFVLVLKRVLSCHPFSRKKMYDPAPSFYNESSTI